MKNGEEQAPEKQRSEHSPRELPAVEVERETDQRRQKSGHNRKQPTPKYRIPGERTPDTVTSEVAQIARQENHPHSGQNITGQEKKQRLPAVFPMSSRAGRVDKRRSRNLLPGRKLPN